jgi:hypothetical protein
MTVPELVPLTISAAGVILGVIRLESEWGKNRNKKEREYTMQTAIHKELVKIREYLEPKG